LSKGCSVGCKFCGLSARPLEAVFDASPNNLSLWKDVVSILCERFGPVIGPGAFCYWATDPLDNPDYEIFLQQFYRITGALPQTTTALAHRNIERAHALIRLNSQVGFLPDRFSVVSRNILRKLHKQFSPEDLFEVELITQNPESIRVQKIQAGRYYKAASTVDRHSRNGDGATMPGTIACIAGFLIKMVERTIELISPCEASDDHPMGYQVHCIRSFENANDLGGALDEIMSEQMPIALTPNDEVRLWHKLRFQLRENSICLEAPYGAISSDNESAISIAVATLAKSPLSVSDLIQAVSARSNPIAASVAVQHLYERGLIDRHQVSSRSNC
jgi:radical SAM family RiPP maturation amino acid epimerase